MASPRPPRTRPGNLSPASPVLAGLLALASLAAPAVAEPTSAPAPRLVCLGAPATQIALALGAGPWLVGVDADSPLPEDWAHLPRLGGHRSVSVEPVLAVRPTLVLAGPEVGPPANLDLIAAAGIRVVRLPDEHGVAGAQARVRRVAQELGLVPAGEALAAKIAADAAAASRPAAGVRVLFLYARGPRTLMVSGRGTAADAMLAAAGAVNTVTDYEGYKPLTPEAAIAAAPDVLLLTASGLTSIGGVDGVLGLPGLALTPAGRARRIVTVDDLALLGSGPETGAAIATLSQALADALATPAPPASAAAAPAAGRSSWAIVAGGLAVLAALGLLVRQWRARPATRPA